MASWPLCKPHKHFASIPVPAWSHSPITFLLDFTQPTPLTLQVTIRPTEAFHATSRPTPTAAANILAPLEPSQALCLHSSDRLVTLLPSLPAGLYPVNPCNNSGDRLFNLNNSKSFDFQANHNSDQAAPWSPSHSLSQLEWPLNHHPLG